MLHVKSNKWVKLYFFLFGTLIILTSHYLFLHLFMTDQSSITAAEDLINESATHCLYALFICLVSFSVFCFSPMQTKMLEKSTKKKKQICFWFEIFLWGAHMFSCGAFLWFPPTNKACTTSNDSKLIPLIIYHIHYILFHSQSVCVPFKSAAQS